MPGASGSALPPAAFVACELVLHGWRAASPRYDPERLMHAAFDRNRVARHWEDQPVGTPEDVAERLAPYVALGYRHLVGGFPADYDEESMTRLATEVKPMLEKTA